MKTITVYISAALLEVEYAAAIRDELAKLGVSSTSSWIDMHLRDGARIDPSAQPLRAEYLAKNIADLQRATAVVFLAHVGTPRAGHWDACWGLANSKPVFWCVDGDRGANLWTSHPGVTVISRAMNERQLAQKIATALERQLGGGKARVA